MTLTMLTPTIVFIKRSLAGLIFVLLMTLCSSPAICIEHMPEPNPPYIEMTADALRPESYKVFSEQAAPTVEWTFHKTADNAHPDGNEQQMVWLMNRARSNPTEEGNWLSTMTDPNVSSALSYFGVNLNLLKSEFAALAVKPPAAFDVRLYNAAYAHSQDLIARDAQDHTGQFDLVTNAGFSFLSARGNVFSYADNALYCHAAFNIDWGYGGDGSGMQDDRGHRKAIMAIDGNFMNVGLVLVPDSNPGTDVGPLVVTGNYCVANTGVANHFNRFLVGTVWEDLNANGQYDPGEGKAGVHVRPDSGTYFAVTANSGGYAIPMTAIGTYHVTFSGAALPFAIIKTAVISGNSILLDIIVGIDTLVKGDVNTDGVVNLEDLVVALQVASGIQPAGSVTLSADVNGDGKIGMAEAIYTLQKVAGLQ